MSQVQISKSQVSCKTEGNEKKRVYGEGDGIITKRRLKKVELKPKGFTPSSAIQEDIEILDIPLPFKVIGHRSSLTNIHDLLEHCPQPQAPITVKQLKSLQLNENNAKIMHDQIRLIKASMENMQDYIKHFCCNDKFRDDVDYIVANVRSVIAKSEQSKKK